MGTNANYTLEEILSLTNDELLSNWSRLASLIKSYEGIAWEEARPKAIDLMQYGKAVDYITQIRNIVSGKVGVEKEEPILEEPEQKKTSRTKKSNSLIPKVTDVHQSNYIKLLRVVPDLEQRILSGKEVYGKSKRTGFMDFNLELIHQDKTGYYLAISHYYKENGDMIADPDMVVLVNLKHQTVIPLSYQDRYKYKTTYDDIYHRKLINVKELKAQSSFLSFWLGNLKKQGHKIKWEDPDGTGELHKEQPPKQTEPETPVIEISSETFESSQSVEIEEILKYWKRFASFIRKYEGISQEEAEEKALKLKEEDKGWDYLENALDKNEKVNNDSLFRENYKALIALIPDLREHLRNEELKGILSSSKSNTIGYEIGWAKDLSSTTSCLVIFELSENQSGEIGTLLLGINRVRKMAWIHLLDNQFFVMGAFNDEEVSADSKARYNINKKLSRWLDLLIGRDYKIEWKHIKDSETNEQEEEKQDVNKDIPDFAPGQVELTEAHKRAGLTQKHINWINKHKQGMVITPRRNMTNNTRDFLMDQAVQAKKPGFRVSKTGKLYYEGRSNRSDLTDGGL
ncbi:hypothetical protein G5B10_13225 [Fluviicola sp. SGL-29]|nr:hypothetical protein [Fluviicola sp. SGL-29]